MEKHYCPNCGESYYCFTVKCDKPYKTDCIHVLGDLK